jgi:TPR repeat protein
LNKLGSIYYSGSYGQKQNYSAAFDNYDKAVKLGDIKGCVYLGYMYANGYGVDKNIAKAIEYYKRDNSALANNNIGWIYEKGDGVEKDLEKAAGYYQKSSDAGNATATRNLARFYRDGIQFRKDMEKAIELYKKAAKAGDKYSMDWLKERYLSA